MMWFHSILAIFITVLALLCEAAPSQPFHSAVKVTKIFQFPNNGSWAENLIVRPNGHILVTRLDVPELWSIDLQHGTASLVHAFPNVTSLLGIASVLPDVYAIAGIKFQLSPTIKTFPGSGVIFTADLSRPSPIFRTVATLADSILLNGVAAVPLCSSTILVAESALGRILRVDINTGKHTIFSADEPLSPAPNASLPLGVNGLKVRGDYLYFTSSTRGLFGRIPMTSSAVQAGPAQIIESSAGSLDDFVVDESSGVSFAAAGSSNTIVQIEPDGQVTTVAGELTSLAVAGGTALAWVPGEEGRAFYVTTSGAQAAPVNGTRFEPAKIVKVTLGY